MNKKAKIKRVQLKEYRKMNLRRIKSTIKMKIKTTKFHLKIKLRRKDL